MIHNISDITHIFEQIEEHCELADAILNAKDLGRVCDEKQFQN